MCKRERVENIIWTTHTHTRRRQAQQSPCHVSLSLMFRFIVAVFSYNTRHFHLNFMPQVQPATAATLRAGYKSNAYAPYTAHRQPSHILFSFPSATIDVAQLNLIRLLLPSLLPLLLLWHFHLHIQQPFSLLSALSSCAQFPFGVFNFCQAKAPSFVLTPESRRRRRRRTPRTTFSSSANALKSVHIATAVMFCMLTTPRLLPRALHLPQWTRHKSRELIPPGKVPLLSSSDLSQQLMHYPI